MEAAHLSHRDVGGRCAGRHRPRPGGRRRSVQVRRRSSRRPAPQLHPRRSGLGREVPHRLPGRRRPGRPPGRGLPPGHPGPDRAGHPLRPGLPAGQPGPLPLRRLLGLAGDRRRRTRRPPDQGARRQAAGRRAHRLLPGAVLAGPTRSSPPRPQRRAPAGRTAAPWSSTTATASRAHSATPTRAAPTWRKTPPPAPSSSSRRAAPTWATTTGATPGPGSATRPACWRWLEGTRPRPALVDVFEQSGHVFLVEEYFDAPSLRDVVEGEDAPGHSPAGRGDVRSGRGPGRDHGRLPRRRRRDR